MADIYDANNFDPLATIGGLIGRTRSAMFGALGEAMSPYDITPPQYVTIVMLASGASARPADICKKIQYDPGAMTRIIDQLEKRNLVRRISDADDRRAINLELTKEGKALYPKLLEAAVKVLNQFLEGFTKTEVKQMEEFLRRMLRSAAEIDKNFRT